ncbi:MAG: hypothetical protein L0170_03760, partial [Acidobacteria bacterium]|nr:hypothetical protein [Acidobacteriota bacterium]
VMLQKAKRTAVIALGIIGCLATAQGARKEAPAEPVAAAVKGARESVQEAPSAAQVFGKFQALAGIWRGRSTKGWTGEASFEVIAAGSVVAETSRFQAHPDETMMTMYHLDGSTMLLTHYCVAKNQPRLEMSSLSEDGRKVTFRFRDGTNLASRNQGHMDSVVYQFEGPDRFTSQWSFYKDGKEEWMEEIHYERIR